MEYQPIQEDPAKKIIVKNEPSTAAKVTVLIVLIALLIVGILLPIKLVPNALSTFGENLASFFNKTTLSVDTSHITVGAPFTLKWNGTTETDGTYALSYNCIAGISFETSVNQPHQIIACGTPYYFPPQSSNSISITPLSISATSSTASVPVTLSFIKNGNATTTKLATQTLTVNAGGLLAQNSIGNTNSSTTTVSIPTITDTVTPTSTPTKTPTPVVAQPTPSKPTSTGVSPVRGPADLTIIILSTGYVNPTTNIYTPSATIPYGMRASIRFEVKNIGGMTSDLWSFTAKLPSTSNPIYTAYNQRSLHPGDYTIYTIGFDNLAEYHTNPFTITVNPTQTVRESSYANNTASGTIIND